MIVSQRYGRRPQCPCVFFFCFFFYFFKKHDDNKLQLKTTKDNYIFPKYWERKTLSNWP